MDENGIPETAAGRVEIAKKILEKASEYGISKKDIIFDPLALTVSADNNAAAVTLESVKRIKTNLGCHTSLGVSNVSFGLPARDGINSVFFALALENGLSAAIMNPYSADMMRTYYAFKALKGMDENCAEYISHSGEFLSSFQPASQSVTAITGTSPLMDAVIKGLKEKAVETTKELLASKAPLDIVNEDIIPALNKVGEGFEKNIIFFPACITCICLVCRL